MSKQDQFYEKYWSWRKEQKELLSGYVRNRAAFAADVICRRSESVRVLDIGCGEGALGRILSEQENKDAFDLVGVDISSQALELCRPYYRRQMQVNLDEERLRDKLQGEPFDFIVCMEVLEHLFSPQETLREIAVLLKPKGQVITSIPNFAFFRHRWEVLRGRFPEKGTHVFHQVEHLHYFTTDSFREFLNSEGFVVVEHGGNYSLPRLLKPLPRRWYRGIGHRWPGLFAQQFFVVAERRSPKQQEEKTT